MRYCVEVRRRPFKWSGLEAFEADTDADAVRVLAGYVGKYTIRMKRDGLLIATVESLAENEAAQAVVREIFGD